MSVIKIDADGRMKLPAAIRRQLNLNGEDELALDCLQDGTLILKKVNSGMRFEKWLNR
jgi:AbrB family looped-hinge helix DNA binding protein